MSLCGGGSITRFILADVSGHGDAVADVAKALRDLMRRNINRKDQDGLVRALNRQFAELSGMNRFATAVVATYLTAGDSLTVCNAGHPRPLWRPAGTGTWVAVDPAAAGDDLSDLPLGIVPDTAYTRHRITLGRGDLLLFYTDALTECENRAGGQLGEDGLVALVNRLDATDAAALPAALTAPWSNTATAPRTATTPPSSCSATPPHPGVRETLSVYAKLLGMKSV